MNKLFVLYSCVYSKVSLKESLRLFFYCLFPLLCMMMDSHTEHSQSAVNVNSQFPTFFSTLGKPTSCDVRGGPVVKIWSIAGPHKE